jgi:glycosyltransferase involved in cell wall biosynthesis
MINARGSERVMLYVGRIAREKNIPLLLEAAAAIMGERSDTRLWMVGDGPFRKEAQRLARELGIGDRVKFIGAVPRVEVDKFYIAADLFLFASVTETQGLVIGEAMSYGVPAVAVRGGGASSAIQEGVSGLIVPNSSSQLAQAALSLISNPARLGRMAEASKRVVKLWTHHDMCDEVEKVYEAAIKRSAVEVREVVDVARAN